MRTGPLAQNGDDAVRRVLEQRAAALARPVDEDAGRASTELLILAVGAQHVALPADRAREMLPPGAIARVPAGGPLVGVRGVRGEILAVADLTQLLGLTTTVAVGDRWVAVVDDAVAPLGLLVDTAIGMSDVAFDALDERPGRRDGGLVSAVTPGGALLLDADALLTDPRLFIDSRLSSEEEN